MAEKEKVFIFDEDDLRRNRINWMLSSDQIHSEPCQSLSDYQLDFPTSGIVLAYDGGDNVHEVIAHMKDQGVWLPVIAYDVDPKLKKVVRAMNAGAVDYLSWPFDRETFIKHTAALSERISLMRQVLLRERRAKRRLASLSERELEVLCAMGQGNTNAEIGAELEISPRTVEIHRNNAIKKLGAQRTADAIRILMEAEIAGPSYVSAPLLTKSGNDRSI